MNRYRWRLLPSLPFEHPLNASSFSPLIKQLLYNRGLLEQAQVDLFFNADSRLAGDPWLLPDMQPAVSRIYQALLGGEAIAVYGDFDVDGMSATALLVKGLNKLGGQVTPYIPHRLYEGHGLNSYALAELKEHGIKLVITADCGITSSAKMPKTRPAKQDIIITDHHLPLDELPPAIAVIDPKRSDSNYPFSDLAGVGVAFKLLQALYQGIGREKEVDRYLDLVALGTVADVMPLLGENRYLVKAGLECLKGVPSPGIRELANQAGINLSKLDTQDISWGLAPRLNAAGRLEHAISGYQLLMTDSEEEAHQIAQWLNEKNGERQKLTSTALSQAREQVLAKGVAPLLIACHQEYPEGILGLVAGKLAEEFYHPAIVIQIGDEISHGSCRSIPEFNISQAVSQCAELLTRFGGHRQAAGFTLPTRNIPLLEEKLNELAARELAGLELCPRLDIDTLAKLSELGGKTYQLMQKMAPFGMGNPAPTFLSRGVRIADWRTMGANGSHLRFKLKQDNVAWEAVAFGLGERPVQVELPLDIVYNLEHDEWNGESRLRLNILDFAPTGVNI